MPPMHRPPLLWLARLPKPLPVQLLLMYWMLLMPPPLRPPPPPLTVKLVGRCVWHVCLLEPVPMLLLLKVLRCRK